MLRSVVWFQAVVVLLVGVGATIDLRFLSRRQTLPNSKANCEDNTLGANRNLLGEVWRQKRSTITSVRPTHATFPTFPLLNTNEILARRIDHLLPNAEDIVKEHAKLVQDINGLRQVVFVKPLADETRDYEESVFHEVIEVSSTVRPTPRPTSPRPPLPPPPFRPKPSSIPIILLGGASQQEIVRAQPMKFSKPISLVGTSITPLSKHPYPFVVHGTQKPYKICMNPMHLMYTSTTQRPSLLQRLLSSILPRGR